MEIKSSADFVRMTRAALAAAGFVRHEIEDVVYWTAGSGAPLALIHGVNDQAGTWFTIAPALARTHRVIVPDLAGHGESAPKSGPLPISLVLAKLHALLGDLEDLTLIGNSFGGWMALHYALDHPQHITRLILEASGGLNRPLAVPLIARNREEADVILRAVHGPAYQAPEWVITALLERAADAPMLRLTEMLEHDVEPRLGDIRAETHLLWGANDGVIPLDYAHALQAKIPGARLHVIEGAAHIPHMQQPQRVLECLTSIF